MDCEVIQVEPRSDQHWALRRCRITASRLGIVMSKPTTKGYQKLQRQLALELAGAEFAEDDGPWFEHGRSTEPRAIGAAKWKYHWDDFTNNVFLIHHKYDWFGCSPDGLINNLTEGAEFKCRWIYAQYQRARDKGLEPAHRFQLNGAMWITGFLSWWYLNYYEHKKTGVRKLCRILVPRDDALIEQMEARCIIFMDEVYKLAGLK